MIQKQVDPNEVAVKAVQSLGVIAEAMREALKSDEVLDATTEMQRKEAQLTALVHLNNIANALKTLDALHHIITHVNKPALNEALAAYHRCMQEPIQVH